MKIKLPLIGEVKVGKDVEEPMHISSASIPQPNLKDKEKVFSILGGMIDVANNRLSDNKTISSKLLEANKDWVYRNNDVIAQEVAQMEFELYQIGLSKGEIVYTEVEEHPMLDLLDKFNATTTKSDGLYNTQSHKKLTGDAFWLLVRNGRQIEGIVNLQPDKVELELGNPAKGEPLVKAYKYKDTIDGHAAEERYDPQDIIHFKKPNPSNQYRGLGVVEAIAETIDTDILTNLAQKNFFKKGAITNFVLTTDKAITPDQLKRLKAEMKSNNGGAQNAFEMMVLSGGLKPANISFSNRDMQLDSLLAWYRDKIMVGFGNTPASIGIIEDVNQANAKDTLLSWRRGTIKPDMDAIVNTLNEFFVPLFGKNLILGYVNPVPEDRTDDINEAVLLKNAGIIKINEARKLVDYEEVDGGDIFAPNGLIDTPSTPDSNTDEPVTDPVTPPEDDPETEEEAEAKVLKRHIYRKQGRNIKQVGVVPKSLAHLDVKYILRHRGLFGQKAYNHQLREMVKPTIRKMLKEGKTEEEAEAVAAAEVEVRISPYFTNEVIMGFYNKQIHTVDVLEEAFEKAMKKFIGKIEDQVLENFDNELSNKSALKKWVTKDQMTLFDDNKLKTQAQLDLTPILMNEVVLAGQDAYRLIGKEDTYIPFNVASKVKRNVDKFTQSMLDTDRDTLSKLISEGYTNGLGIPEIRNSITNKFEDISRVQSQRITRTEVMRASNLANIDAYKQSGVVEAKQWLTAGATDDCSAYEGKTEKLDDNFYGTETEFDSGDPPLHPNCRCVIIPVVTLNEDGDTNSDFNNEGGFIGEGDDYEPEGEEGEDWQKTWHGEGGQPMNTTPMLGKAFYVSRTKSTAEQFGDVSQYNIPIAKSEILLIKNQDEFDQFIKDVVKYQRDTGQKNTDINYLIPKYVKSLGYRAAEVSETFDPLGGIAVYDKKLLPKQ
jgi:HK97 family phage portal protein